MARQYLVTLLTDFGSAEAYPAAMKGVILRRCGRANIVDISHDIPPHDVLSAAYVLAGAAPWFPPGTVHVIVVDPGVGTDRKILVGKFAGQTYVFPDNGVITMIAEAAPAEQLVAVRNPQFLPRGPISSTFHGRDVFAPIAAELLKGMSLARLGPQPDTFKLLDLPPCEEADGEIRGQVVHVDSFGNLITNIHEQVVGRHWPDLDGFHGFCAAADVGPLQGAYGFVEPGKALMLINSASLIEVAVNRGRASDVLGAAVGTPVRLAAATQPPPPPLPPG